MRGNGFSRAKVELLTALSLSFADTLRKNEKKSKLFYWLAFMAKRKLFKPSNKVFSKPLALHITQHGRLADTLFRKLLINFQKVG